MCLCCQCTGMSAAAPPFATAAEDADLLSLSQRFIQKPQLVQAKQVRQTAPAQLQSCKGGYAHARTHGRHHCQCLVYEQLLACAHEQTQVSGGITADIFAHAVAPLLAFSCVVHWVEPLSWMKWCRCECPAWRQWTAAAATTLPVLKLPRIRLPLAALWTCCASSVSYTHLTLPTKRIV